MNIVLLQGPLGPFFADLADQLTASGLTVHRICFNKGDWHYAKADHVVTYGASADDWPQWFADYVAAHTVQAVVCYGDSRYYHRMARRVCRDAGIDFFACEEGYVRPGFVTFEQDGNNANSPFPEKFRTNQLDDRPMPVPAQIARIFQHQFWFAVMYYIVKDWKLLGFGRYRHHRTGNWATEMMAWLRAGYRKHCVTRFRERGLTAKLVQGHQNRLFLVPLQVAVDTQMIYHSRFDSVADFIAEVMQSFAVHAVAGSHLVIKHHPMDRGFHHYGAHIAKLGKQLGCAERVTYAFDVDLAALLDVAAGCVTVNSTVATQALDANVPTLTLGNSMLEKAGLTASCGLDAFWQSVPPVDAVAVKRFRQAMIAHTQIPGSFYNDRHIAAREIANQLHEKINKNK